MNSSRGNGMQVWGGRLLGCGILSMSVALLGGLSASAAEKGDSQRSRRQKRETISVSDSDRNAEREESECRFEALQGTAKFRGTKTETEVMYEDKLITYKEPETIFKTVCEDQSGWQTCCCRTLFGWRERCVWCPRCVEKQVQEVVEVERQRVDRIQQEITREVPNKHVETVVVHSRRPYVKKPAFSWDEPQFVAERKPAQAAQNTGAADARFGF